MSAARPRHSAPAPVLARVGVQQRLRAGQALPGLLGSLLCALAISAGAQTGAPATATVYRCADGRYTDAPCPGGNPVPVADPRTPAQQAQAREAAQREAAMAAQMTQARQAQEAADRRKPPPVAGIGPAAAAAPASAPAHKAKKPHKPKHPAGSETAKKSKTTTAPPPKPGQLGQY